MCKGVVLPTRASDAPADIRMSDGTISTPDHSMVFTIAVLRWW